MKFLLKHHKLFAIICLLICVLIAILQYNEIGLGVITSYGADFFCPIFLYYWVRRKKDPLSKLSNKYFSPIQVSIGLFTLCLAWELRQLYNSEKYGTFDLLDILVYFIAVLFCYLIDNNIKESLNNTTHNTI